MSQAWRFYLQVLLASLAGGLTTFLSIIVVPQLTGAVIALDKVSTGITLVWGMASYTAVSLGLSLSLYLGERLALDWRRALTRRVRTSSMCASLALQTP